MENDKVAAKVRVGIVGASGYSGLELIRLLKSHPFVEINMLISHSTGGMNIKEIAPHLADIYELLLENVDTAQIAKRVDCLFFATPAGVSQTLVPELAASGITMIDLSGDFRLKDGAVYEEWYQRPAATDDFLKQAVYGLPEFFRNDIKETQFIANPGCYPTAALLGLLPALVEGVVDPDSIIIDAKSGVSGSGRSSSAKTHYCEVNENLSAYKLGSHQHVPEIEQVIQQVIEKKVTVSFSTHLIPMTRGLMCTMYAELNRKVTTAEMVQFYKTFYGSEPFVRISDTGFTPVTKQVYGSNYCDIGLFSDARTNKLTIVSVIDNVVKGAAGQAIQNMNLIYGWHETTGLEFSPIYP